MISLNTLFPFSNVLKCVSIINNFILCSLLFCFNFPSFSECDLWKLFFLVRRWFHCVPQKLHVPNLLIYSMLYHVTIDFYDQMTLGADRGNTISQGLAWNWNYQHHSGKQKMIRTAEMIFISAVHLLLQVNLLYIYQLISWFHAISP